MKIVVIGGSGLIGTKLVKKLRERGDEALPASPSSGVNTITGEGWLKRLPALKLLSMCRTRLPGRTRQFWSFSKRRLGISWPQKLPLE